MAYCPICEKVYPEECRRHKPPPSRYEDLREFANKEIVSARHKISSRYVRCRFIKGEKFFLINAKPRIDGLGWKLHGNTACRHVGKMYDAIYPLLKEYKLRFKVSTEVMLADFGPRSVNYAQFTIYLQRNQGSDIGSSKLVELLEKLDKKLKRHKISVSEVRPKSEVRTKSDYFTLRNDSIDIPWWFLSNYAYRKKILKRYKDSTKLYIKAKLVGNAYNPVNTQLPFEKILDSKDISRSRVIIFEPTSHFDAFDVKSGDIMGFADRLMIAVICTLWASFKHYYSKYIIKKFVSDNYWLLHESYNVYIKYPEVRALMAKYISENKNEIRPSRDFSGWFLRGKTLPNDIVCLYRSYVSNGYKIERIQDRRSWKFANIHRRRFNFQKGKAPEIEDISGLAINMLCRIRQLDRVTPEIFTDAIDVMDTIEHSNNFLVNDRFHRNFRAFLKKALLLSCSYSSRWQLRYAAYLNHY